MCIRDRFVTLCILTPFTDFVVSLTPDNPVAQIANVHTIFNISTTLILLPFGALLEKIAIAILPDKAAVSYTHLDVYKRQYLPGANP